MAAKTIEGGTTLLHAMLRRWRPRGGGVPGFLVANGGFAWRDDLTPSDGGDDGPWLVPRGQFTLREGPRDTEVVAAFAALSRRPGLDSIAAFADAYGFLTEPLATLVDPNGRLLGGESWTRWLEECRSFHDLWTLWQGVLSATDRRALDERIRWFRHGDATWPGPIEPVEFEPQPPDVILRRLRLWLQHARSGDALQPYRSYILRRSLDRLNGHVMTAVDEIEGRVAFQADCVVSTVYMRLANEVLRSR